MKALHPVKRIDSSRKKVKKFATSDIESHNWTEFVVIGFYDGHSNTYKYFSKLSKYLDFAFEHCWRDSIQSIFCHFGGKFDFNFILEEACFNNNYRVDNIIPRGSGLLSFEVYQSEPTLFDVQGKPFKIVFRDSSALLPFALRTLAQTFKVEMQKGEVDYSFIGHAWKNENYIPTLLKNPQRYEVYYGKRKIKTFNKKHALEKITYIDKEDGNKKHKVYNRKDLLKYLEADNISQWQVIKVFYEWSLVKRSGESFTTAGQAVKIWQTFLSDRISSIGKHIDTFIRKGYFGGRTEVFKPFFDNSYDTKTNPFDFPDRAIKILEKQKGKKLYYVDVNSLYPTVMRDHVYPVSFDKYVYTEDYAPDILAFWECDVYVPKMFCPPLGVKHIFEDGTEKFIFPTGNIKGVWTTHELEYAKTLGCKITRIYKGCKFKSGGYIFKDFIDELYNIRLQAKREGDETSNMLAKLIMNSCYGRLGLNTQRTNLVIDVGQLGITHHSEIKRNGETVRFGEIPVSLDDSFTNVAIPAYVTAYSRILMHRDIYMKAGPEHLYYTDTDSAFTTKDLKHFKIGDELGELKLEYTCNSACFLLPKTYINDNIEGLDDKDGQEIAKKLTMKGFDKKKIKGFTMEDFAFALKGDLSRLKVYQDPKFATLKTALKKGRFLAMNFDPVSQKEYDKKDLMAVKRAIKKCNRSDLMPNLLKIKTKLERKLKNDDYKGSVRQIKSVYDKRDIIEWGFNTRPIHLTKEKS